MKKTREFTTQIADEFMVANVLYQPMANGKPYRDKVRYPGPSSGTARSLIMSADDEGYFSFDTYDDGRIEQVGLLGCFTDCHIDVPWADFCNAFDRSKLKGSGDREYKGTLQVNIQGNRPA